MNTTNNEPFIRRDQTSDLSKSSSEIIPQNIGGNYEVVRILSGGMGTVYFCVDHNEQDTPVALKTLQSQFIADQQRIDRFLRECSTWISIGRHPNVVFARNVEQIGSNVYLIMDLIGEYEGKPDASLRSWLVPGKPISLQDALLFSIQISRGMKFAVKRVPGLVHRDLKPENVLIDGDKTAYVTDFGLSKILGDGSANIDTEFTSQLTSRNLLCRTQLTGFKGGVGTPLYMAPEQWKDGQQIDQRADIYAFGCILFEMLTGQFAALGIDVNELRSSHCNGQLRILPNNVPSEIRRVINSCLALAPNNRFQTWGQLENDLTDIYQKYFGDIPKEPNLTSQDHSESVSRAFSFLTIGRSYLSLGKPDVAIKYCQRMVDIGTKNNHLGIEHIGTLNIAYCYHHLEKPHLAIQSYERCMHLENELFNNPFSVAYYDLGDEYCLAGMSEKAVELFTQALEKAKTSDIWFLEMNALRGLGYVYSSKGEWENAINSYEQALALSIIHQDGENIDERNRLLETRSDILMGLGTLYYSSSNLEQSLNYYQQSLPLLESLGKQEKEAQVFFDCAITLEDMGDIAQAAACYYRSIGLFQNLNIIPKSAQALLNLGLLMVKVNRFQDAISCFENSFSLMQQLNDIEGLHRASRNLFIANAKLGNYKDAYHYGDITIQLYEQLGLFHDAKEFRNLIQTTLS